MLSKKVATGKRKTPARKSAPAMVQAEPVTKADAPDATKQPVAANFPIVCLGASAGGLEAFEQFFRHAATDSGMAYVLVSHLDPDHVSILTEILQRTTRMTVSEAEDQMVIAPDHVYVIPPNRDMTIFHGTLQLSLPDQPRGQRMPIDAFLRTLADDRGESSFGIILSGTGTDGTLGLRAILGAGGVTLAQEPASAKYDGMPMSAINAGYATLVLPPEKMPQALQAAKRRLGDTSAKIPTDPAPKSASGTNRILMQLRTSTGHDFSLYKKSTIGRRIERRMLQHDIADTEIYARFLKEHPAETQILFKELLINVTSFFRDPEAFDVLRSEVLPKLFQDKPDGYVFRVWVAGCASGEEAYSVAILLRELMEETRPEFKIQLYATDLDDDAIAIARAGVYPPNIAQDISPERLRRFFTKEPSGYRVKKDIREMVVFAVQNVIKDPPFTKLDLLCCRNLMIYLEPELQNRLIPAFHYALKPGGVLFLSPSESIGNHTDLFAPINRKWKLYSAIHSIASKRAMLIDGLNLASEKIVKAPEEKTAITKPGNFAELARRQLLQSYAPASVVTDLRGNILYVHGETGKFLRPAPGEASLNVVDMARDEMQIPLRTALHQADGQSEPTFDHDVAIKSDGETLNVRFSVRPLPDADIGQGYLLVSFQILGDEANAKPVARTKAGGKRLTGPAAMARIEALESELKYTKDNLHSTVEEHQAYSEELKSINEEMQSTNEELQSTNEELETSKEEMQSVNEELITVNTELQSKIEQLAGMQNDMKNLLDNINVGTIFLDDQLNIKRYTREAIEIYRLVATDIGRPLIDIKSNLENDDLLTDAQAVLDDLRAREREVCTMGGVWYSARIQPYRTLDNVIRGVVITFSNIAQRVASEAAVRQARMLAEGIVNTVREPLVVLDGGLKVVSASRSFYQHFKVSEQETVGQLIYDLGNRQWNIPDLRKLLENILPENRSFDDFAVEHDFPVIGHHKMMLNARRIVGADGNTQMILLSMQAVT
ncbi:CheR family methyltransferase [Sideroxydans sp.]